MRCMGCGREIMASAVYCPYCSLHVKDAVEPQEYMYEAFISYRHLPHDREVAIRVQRSLEGTVIPKELRGNRKHPRFGKLFRDEDELSTAASLSDMIVKALEQSRYLIVICSPQTRESKWVLQEVETFASLHGRERILIALAEGEPDVSFPPLLLSYLERDEDGEEYVEVPSEPLAANFRRNNRKNFRREIARLEASMLGCQFDDLLQRLRMRRLRTNIALSLILATASIGFGSYTLHQRMQIAENLRQSQINESKLLAREAQELLDDGDRISALKVCLRALPEQGADDPRPFVPAARLSLQRSLGVYPTVSLWKGLYSVSGAQSLYDSRDGIQAMEELGSAIVVSTIDTGDKLSRFVPPTLDKKIVNPYSVVFGKHSLLCSYGTTLYCIAPDTADINWQAEMPAYCESWRILYLEESQQYLVYPNLLFTPSGDNSFVFLFDEMTGELEKEISIPELSQSIGSVNLEVSPDEKSFIICTANAKEENSWHLCLATREGTVADHIVVSPVTSGDAAVYDVDVMSDFVVISYLTNTENNVIDKAAFECFSIADDHFESKWRHEEPCNQVDDGELSFVSIGVIGSVIANDKNNQIACFWRNNLAVLDSDTGESIYHEETSEPIEDAFIATVEDDGFTIVGTTTEGNAFLRSPLNNTVQEDMRYTTFVGSNIVEAHPIYMDDAFVGLAAWQSSPACYRIFTVRDYLLSDYLEHVSGMGLDQYVCDEGIVCWDVGSLSLIDPNSFAQKWKVSTSTYGFSEEDDTQTFALGPLVLYGDLNVDDNGELSLTEVSSTDGSILETHKVKIDVREYPASYRVIDYIETSDNKRVVLMTGENSFVAYDLNSKKVLAAANMEDADVLEAAILSDNAVVLRILGDNFTSSQSYFKIYSLDTGEPISGSLTTKTASDATGATTIAGLTSELCVVKCFDGYLRAYYTADGSLCWESSGSLRNTQFIASISGLRILVQDDIGKCSLINTYTGDVEISSETVLPKLNACSREEGDNELFTAQYANAGTTRHYGLVVFTTENNDFGPIEDVTYGTFLSKDGKKVLVAPPWEEDVLVYSRMSLNAMIKEANMIVGEFDALYDD